MPRASIEDKSFDRNRLRAAGVIFAMRPTLVAGVVVLIAFAVAGCGDSSGHRKAAEKRQVSLPAYGSYKATTETVSPGSAATCRFDATTLGDDAVKFLVPSPTPPDVYFIGARTAYYDFIARRCKVALLRDTLTRRLTPRQRQVIAVRFPFLDESVLG